MCTGGARTHETNRTRLRASHPDIGPEEGGGIAPEDSALPTKTKTPPSASMDAANFSNAFIHRLSVRVRSCLPVSVFARIRPYQSASVCVRPCLPVFVRVHPYPSVSVHHSEFRLTVLSVTWLHFAPVAERFRELPRIAKLPRSTMPQRIFLYST